MKHTYSNAHARYGLTGSDLCIVPDQVAHDQEAYDGKTFFALVRHASGLYRKARVRLVGDDYGLHTGGTGDMIVRPILAPRGEPMTIERHNTPRA
jgi:hypothetical protein